MTGDTEIAGVAIGLVPVSSELGEGCLSQTNVRILQLNALGSYPETPYPLIKEYTLKFSTIPNMV